MSSPSWSSWKFSISEPVRSVRVFLHVKTPGPRPEIVLYSFTIEAGAWILPDYVCNDIRDAGSEVQCVELCKNPAMSCESLGCMVELLLGYKLEALNLSCNPQLGDSMIAAIQ